MVYSLNESHFRRVYRRHLLQREPLFAKIINHSKRRIVIFKRSNDDSSKIYLGVRRGFENENEFVWTDDEEELDQEFMFILQ